EEWVAARDDEHLAKYFEPGSPGMFDHKVTAGRIDEAARQLGRISTHAFGTRSDDNGRGRPAAGRPGQRTWATTRRGRQEPAAGAGARVVRAAGRPHEEPCQGVHSMAIDNDDVLRRAWEVREDFRRRGLFTTTQYREALGLALPGVPAVELDRAASRVDRESTR